MKLMAFKLHSYEATREVREYQNECERVESSEGDSRIKK